MCKGGTLASSVLVYCKITNFCDYFILHFEIVKIDGRGEDPSDAQNVGSLDDLGIRFTGYRIGVGRDVVLDRQSRQQSDSRVVQNVL